MHVYPESVKTPTVSPPDQQRLEAAVRLACSSPGNTLHLETRQWVFDKTLDFKTQGYLAGLRVIGGLWWKSLIYQGTGPAMRFSELKQSRIEDIGIYSDSGDSALQFLAHQSSSEVTVDKPRIQGFKTGIDCVAPGGADMSVYHIIDPSFVDCGKGIKVTGSNALDFDIDNPRGTNCKTLIDLRQGGAGSVIRHPGGSFCERLLWANGGYWLTVSDVTSEWNKVCVIEVGGEGDSECDAGGFGQNMQCNVSFLDNRSLTGDLLRIGCDGIVQTGFNAGRIFARAESRTGTLRVSGKAPVVTQGKWDVIDAGTVTDGLSG